MEEYTILLSIITYGHAAIPCKKEEVKERCERLINCNKLANSETYICIEVVNNNTGEIREFWNNKQNQKLF